jgi:hypothetical protein
MSQRISAGVADADAVTNSQSELANRFYNGSKSVSKRTSTLTI